MKEYNKLLEIIDSYQYKINNLYEDLLKELKYDLLIKAKQAYISIVNVNKSESKSLWVINAFTLLYSFCFVYEL